MQRHLHNPSRLPRIARAAAALGLSTALVAAAAVGAGAVALPSSSGAVAIPAPAEQDDPAGDPAGDLGGGLVDDLAQLREPGSSRDEVRLPVDATGDEQGMGDDTAAARLAGQAAAHQREQAAIEAERVAAEQAAAAATAEAERVAAEQAAAAAAAEAAAEAERVAAEAERVAAEQAAEAQSLGVEPGTNRAIAAAMIGDYGWGATQFECLDVLWQRESNWNHLAENPSSGAYGIPQSLPANKMASAGADWPTNPATQISWGLTYISERYGSPCSAWSFWQSNNWY